MYVVSKSVYVAKLVLLQLEVGRLNYCIFYTPLYKLEISQNQLFLKILMIIIYFIKNYLFK